MNRAELLEISNLELPGKKTGFRKLRFFLISLFGFSVLFASVSDALPETAVKVIDHDPFGIWRRAPHYQLFKQRGGKILLMPEENNFFAVWLPEGPVPTRIMVAVHGTGGNPYEEMKDEIPMAQQFHYAVVGINWFSRERGFLPAPDLYRNILEALSYMRSEYGNDLSKVAYIGFSRGSAVSYEVAHLDVTSNHIFDLFISHSGGIPKNFKVEAKNPGAQADAFFKQLAYGELGPDAMKGAKFFLYSGGKDEHWGPEMSEQVEYAASLIKKYGGEVVDYVRDPDGGHEGLRRKRWINEKAVQDFIQLTP